MSERGRERGGEEGEREGGRRLQILTPQAGRKPSSTNQMPSLTPGIHQTSWQRAAVSPPGSEAGSLPVRCQLQLLKTRPGVRRVIRDREGPAPDQGAPMLLSLCREHPPPPAASPRAGPEDPTPPSGALSPSCHYGVTLGELRGGGVFPPKPALLLGYPAIQLTGFLLVRWRWSHRHCERKLDSRRYAGGF